MTSRRQFLLRGAAATAAALAPDLLLAAARKQTPPAPDLSSWNAVRAQFDLAPGWIHLSSFYIASHPKPVREAIEGFRRALDANPYLEVEHRWFSDPPDNLQLAIREEIAPYLGAKAEEIALTNSTTQGLGLVYNGLPLKPGDDVLTTTHDHYAQHESIRFACERTNATTRRIALYEDPARATLDDIVRRLRDAIRLETRVLGLTWVHSCTGVRLPIRAIADMVAEVNLRRNERDRVRMIVDGAHGLGAVDEAVAALGCDYFCAGTHKWMHGPRGTGIVWARADEWARLNALAAIPVRVVTPLDPRLSAGILCFEIGAMKADEIGKQLVARKIVAGASPYLPSYARFSPGVMNTLEEVDAAVQAVKEIARG